MLSSVDLPLPDGPEQHDEFALADFEIEIGERAHLDFAHPVNLGKAPCDEYQGGASLGVDRVHPGEQRHRGRTAPSSERRHVPAGRRSDQESR